MLLIAARISTKVSILAQTVDYVQESEKYLENQKRMGRRRRGRNLEEGEEEIVGGARRRRRRRRPYLVLRLGREVVSGLQNVIQWI
jgi:hypothetical protein